MTMAWLGRLNWVDLVVGLIFVRIVFVGINTGFVIEFFKFLGTVFTVFVCLHYFSPLSALLASFTSSPLVVAVCVTFPLFWFFLFLLCKIVRDGLLMVFSIEAQAFVDKWGGALVGSVRACFVASMILFLFLLTENAYLESMTARSLSGRYLARVSPGVYQAIHEALVAKLFPGDRLNPEVARQLGKIERR